MTKPLFAFFGTSDFTIPALEALDARGYQPALVVTAPDRPQGRGLIMTASPVKEWALARGIDILTPESLTEALAVEELQNSEWDFFLVASYGKILPKEILDIPRRGCLNIHPSLLPKFRGPSPIISSILADDPKVGVTIMLMDEGLDSGPVIAQATIEIDEADWPPTNSILSTMLFTEGGRLVAEILPEWLRGTVDPTPQDASLATLTKKFVSADSEINFSGSPRDNFLKIRAFDSGPRAYFLTPSGERVIVTSAAWQGGTLVIEKVIPQGKREMSYEEYQRMTGKA